MKGVSAKGSFLLKSGQREEEDLWRLTPYWTVVVR